MSQRCSPLEGVSKKQTPGPTRRESHGFTTPANPVSIGSPTSSHVHRESASGASDGPGGNSERSCISHRGHHWPRSPSVGTENGRGVSEALTPARRVRSSALRRSSGRCRLKAELRTATAGISRKRWRASGIQLSSRKVRRSRTLRAISLGAGTNGVLGSLQRRVCTAWNPDRLRPHRVGTPPLGDIHRPAQGGHGPASNCTNAALVPMPSFHFPRRRCDAERSVVRPSSLPGPCPVRPFSRTFLIAPRKNCTYAT